MQISTKKRYKDNICLRQEFLGQLVVKETLAVHFIFFNHSSGAAMVVGDLEKELQVGWSLFYFFGGFQLFENTALTQMP